LGQKAKRSSLPLKLVLSTVLSRLSFWSRLFPQLQQNLAGTCENCAREHGGEKKPTSKPDWAIMSLAQSADIGIATVAPEMANA